MKMKKTNKEAIAIPAGFQCELEGGKITLKYQGKEATKRFKTTALRIEKAQDQIVIAGISRRKNIRAVSKTVSTHIKNMMYGLKNGFEYKLEVVYSHFPIGVSVKKGEVEITNLAGRKHPIRVPIVGSTAVEVKGKDIFVRGIDREDAGQTAANLEQASRIKGKDIRVFQDGIYIVSKPKVNLNSAGEA